MSTDDSTIKLKRCGKCGEEKPPTTDYFTRDNSRKDGLYPRCKDCKKAAQAADREKNAVQIRERWNAKKDLYYCNRQKVYLLNREAINEQRRLRYARNPEPKKKASREWYYANHEAATASQKHYYQRNRERIKKYVLSWRSQNRYFARLYNRTWLSRKPHLMAVYNGNRRALRAKLPNTMTLRDIELMMSYWGGKCAITGQSGKIHLDHWIPLASPICPGTIPTNILPVLARLNLSKGKKLPEIWLAERFGVQKAQEVIMKINAYFEWVKSR